jgi:uncharacterized protein (DUF433 family)
LALESAVLTETRYEHILLDEEHVPVVAGTNTKVIEIVLDQQSYGWSPEEIKLQHPYLTLGQIHSALAYYWDHQDELDQDIVRRLKQVVDLQNTASLSSLRARLKKQGLI